MDKILEKINDFYEMEVGRKIVLDNVSNSLIKDAIIEALNIPAVSCSTDGCYECGSDNLRPKEYNCLDCGHDGYCY